MFADDTDGSTKKLIRPVFFSDVRLKLSNNRYQQGRGIGQGRGAHLRDVLYSADSYVIPLKVKLVVSTNRAVAGARKDNGQ
jgi:hypothetical protein